MFQLIFSLIRANITFFTKDVKLMTPTPFVSLVTLQFKLGFLYVLNVDYVMASILEKTLQSSHDRFKQSLKSSKLNVFRKKRDYLLSLEPRGLCEEFHSKCPIAFRLLVEGIIGITDFEKIYSSQYLMNNICEVYSTLAKLVNKNADGYGLLLTTCARDGGLRDRAFFYFCILQRVKASNL